MNNTFQLEFLGCQYNNLLTSLYIKNGANESVNANHSNNINYVCADIFQIGAIQSRVGINCVVSSNCNLANQDFEFSDYFKIYPNPAKNILNIETKNDLTISSLSIYNTLGQLVQVITSPNKTIDISELKTGNYFIKIVSDKGTSNSKFLKE